MNTRKLFLAIPITCTLGLLCSIHGIKYFKFGLFLLQTPTQGPMEQRPSGMFARSGPAGPGFPVNKGKRNESK